MKKRSMVINDFADGLRDRALDQKIATIDGVSGVHLLEEYPPTLIIQLANTDLATMLEVLSMLHIRFQIAPIASEYHVFPEINKK